MSIRNLKRNIPTFPLTSLLLAVVLPVVFTVWLLISSNANIDKTTVLHKNSSHFLMIKDKIVLLDEILTMSANMMVYSGDAIWLERYNTNIELMDNAILTAIELGRVEEGEKNKKRIFSINQKLVLLERKAFSLASSGQLLAAQQMFETHKYIKYKQELASSLFFITDEVEEKLNLLDFELKRSKQANYILSFFGGLLTIAVIIHLGVTVQRWRNMLMMTTQYMYQQELSETKRLDKEVKLRTEDLCLANKLLETNLRQLKLTQDELIEAEKLSSISRLVTGVAHEVNTPLSIGITSNTFLKDNLIELTEKYEMGNLSKKDIEQFFQRSKKSIELVEHNLERSAKLIVSFKNVSSDQFIQDQQSLFLSDYIDKVIFTLSSLLKKANITVNIIKEDTKELITYPGSWAQITTNLVENAIKHGFINRKDDNKINIHIYNDESYHYFIFRDNGLGISKEVQLKVFEAFYTTNRTRGGTGLGLFVVNNIVKQQLKGKVTCSSQLNQFTEFTVKVPNSA